MNHLENMMRISDFSNVIQNFAYFKNKIEFVEISFFLSQNYYYYFNLFFTFLANIDNNSICKNS